MGGGILQLVAYSSQDFYLTGNPQITYFKVVYRRHTNFSMECIKQTINGKRLIGNNGVNNKGSVVISRNGDLVCGGHVRCIIGSNSFLKEYGICGDNIVEDIEVEIGGQRVDKHYKEWNQVWNELTIPESKAAGFKYMTGSFSNSVVKTQTRQSIITYPLNFWFCRNKGMSLPLIALQFHDVVLKFTWGDGGFKYDNVNEFKKADNLHRREGWAETSVSGRNQDGSRTQQDILSYSYPELEVWLDYIYLDTDERRRFSQVSHEYLIEQLQIQKEKDASKVTFPLNLEHPVKELIWTTPKYTYSDSSNHVNDKTIHIELNGHERFSPQHKEYFTLQQPYDHHTSIPCYNIKESEDPVLLSEPISICAQLPVDSKNYIIIYNNTPSNISNKIINDDNITLFKISISNTNINFDTDNIEENIREGDIINVEVIKNHSRDLPTIPGEPNFLFRNTTSSLLYVTKVEVELSETILTCRLKGITGPHLSGKKGKVSGISTLNTGVINTPVQGENTEYIDEGGDIGPPSFGDKTDKLVQTANKCDGTNQNEISGASNDIQLFIGEQLFVLSGGGDEETLVHDIGVFRNYGQMAFTGTGGNLTTQENYLSGTHTIGSSEARDEIIYIAKETFSVTVLGRSQNYKSRCSQLQKDIYVYSFAINPEEHQPSGTCNFSKLDSAKLIFSEASKVSNIYAVNYNILRIMSGMGGLAYAN
jgi:hypothetical protein